MGSEVSEDAVAHRPLIGTVTSGFGLARAEHGRGVWEGFGYEPVPGTLNLKVAGSLPGWLTSRTPARWLADRREHMTVFWPARIGAVDVHVRQNLTAPQVEVVAAVHLRTVLGLADGDEVHIT
jgi:CTP-dependent riboflavin kinase